MKDWQDFVWLLLIGVLVIFFGGWIVGSVLNFAAMASPRMVSTILCPEGSTARRDTDSEQNNSNRSKISCYDQTGKSVPMLSDAESIVLQRKYFYRPSYILMIILVVGWSIRSSIRQRKAKQANL